MTRYPVSMLALLCALFSLAPVLQAQSTESAGDLLLEGLAPESPPPVKRGAPPAARDETEPGAPEDLGPDINFRMPGPLDHWGTDLGQGPGRAPMPLVRAKDRMDAARRLLETVGTEDQAVEAQQEVIASLDQLIEELSRGNGSPGDDSPRPDPPKQGGNAEPGAQESPAGTSSTDSTNSAADSSDRLGAGAKTPVKKKDIDELVKELWGHLPERTREEMHHSYSGEFLPKYQIEIEQYYRRLAEEAAAGSDTARPAE